MKQGNPGGQAPQMNVDLTTTEGLLNSKGKNVFESGVILRKISKFNVGDGFFDYPITNSSCKTR